MDVFSGLSRRPGPRADRPLAWFADLPLAACIYGPAALAGLVLPYALLPSAGRPARAGARVRAGPGAGAPLRAHLLGVAAAHAGLAAAVTAAGAKSGFLPAGWALCALAAAAVAPDQARRPPRARAPAGSRAARQPCTQARRPQATGLAAAGSRRALRPARGPAYVCRPREAPARKRGREKRARASPRAAGAEPGAHGGGGGGVRAGAGGGRAARDRAARVCAGAHQHPGAPHAAAPLPARARGCHAKALPGVHAARVPQCVGSFSH